MSPMKFVELLEKEYPYINWTVAYDNSKSWLIAGYSNLMYIISITPTAVVFSDYDIQIVDRFHRKGRLNLKFVDDCMDSVYKWRYSD